MLVVILGYPFAGKRTLADGLAALFSLRVVTMDLVSKTIERGGTREASRARALLVRGELLPDDLVGELLWEAAGGDDAILVGRPRNLNEMDSFLRASGRFPSVVHLEAIQSLVDERMVALGLGRSEVEHPGALRRLCLAVQPVLARAGQAGRLLALDASLPARDLVESARVFMEGQRALAG